MGDTAEFSLFVGDLAPNVNDQYLETFFKQYFSSVKGGKVITDRMTGRSKGYGFVRFTLESDRDRALNDMNGVYLSTRPMRVSKATMKKATSDRKQETSSTAGGGETDPNNTTLFIGGLSPTVTEEQLKVNFIRFGEIVYTKIPQGKGCGFVQYKERKAAEAALQEMNGFLFNGQAVRISWGKSSGRLPVVKPLATAAAATGAYGFGPYGYPYPDPYSYTTFPDPYTAYTYQGIDPYAQQTYGYSGIAPAAAAAAAAAGNAFHGSSAGQLVPTPGGAAVGQAPQMPTPYGTAQQLALENRAGGLFAATQRPLPFYATGAGAPLAK